MDWPEPHIGHLVLLTTFTANAIVSGMGYGNSAYYYSEWLDAFGAESWLTSMVGSLNIGMVCLMGPVAGTLTNRYGYRLTVFIGGLTSVIGLIGSAFSRNIWTLLAMYCVCGIGWGITYIPISLAVTHYYEPKYYGIIVGAISAGAGFGHFVTPLVADYLTNTYSWRGSMLIQAGISANIMFTSATLRPMPTMTKSKNATGAMGLQLFKNCNFIFFLIHTLVFTIGLSVVFVHLGYGIERFTKVDQLMAALAVSILGLASMFGKMIQAIISKLKSVNAVLQTMISYSIAGICCIVIPFISNFTIITLISALIGFCFGTYGSVAVIIVLGILGRKDAPSAYGYVNFMGGVGLYVGAPIAGALYDSTGSYRVSMFFTAAMFILSGVVLVKMALNWSKDRLDLDVVRDTDAIEDDVAEPLDGTNIESQGI